MDEVLFYSQRSWRDTGHTTQHNTTQHTPPKSPPQEEGAQIPRLQKWPPLWTQRAEKDKAYQAVKDAAVSLIKAECLPFKTTGCFILIWFQGLLWSHPQMMLCTPAQRPDQALQGSASPAQAPRSHSHLPKPCCVSMEVLPHLWSLLWTRHVSCPHSTTALTVHHLALPSSSHLKPFCV